MAVDQNSVSTTALVLIAVVPVVAGVVLTALFTWLSQRRIDKRDHARWLREKRYAVYSEFLRSAADLKGELIGAVGFASRKTPKAEAAEKVSATFRNFTLALEEALLIADTYEGGVDDVQAFRALNRQLGRVAYRVEQGQSFGEQQVVEMEVALNGARVIMSTRFSKDS